MGIDVELVVGDLDPEFICSICCDVMENAKEISGCEHTFCNGCIRTWVKDKDQIWRHQGSKYLACIF